MNERDIPKYSMTIEWSPDDDAFIVTIPELAGSRMHGESYADAVKNGQQIIELIVAGLVQDGQEPPAPSYFQNGELVELRSRHDHKAVRRAS
jgi:antitoxin HicB